MLKLRAVVWDLDGTLINSVPRAYAAVVSIFTECKVMPPTFEEWCEVYTPPDYTFFQDRGIVLPREEFRAIYQKRAGHESAELFPDVIDCLESLQGLGLEFCLVSSQRHDIAVERCRSLGLVKYFRSIRANSPDKAECLTATCRELGLSPDTVAYVGDFGHDMSDSKRAGMIPIGITRGNKTKEALFRRGACYVIDHLPELLSIINNTDN